MKNLRIEPPLNNKGTSRTYYNDEWNQVDKSPSQEKQYTNVPSGDEDHEDFVDTYYPPSEYKKNTWEYTDDDYEEYGH